MEQAWAMALEANFGSVERWRSEFVAMGHALGGEAICLAFRRREGTLVNLRCTDLGDAVAILVRDGPSDVETFIDRIDSGDVYAPYQAAVHDASETFAAEPADVPGRLLLDVRRAGVYAQATQLVDGARWRDPAKVAQWSGELRAGDKVVVYCVYGHEVGRATALRLRAAGLDARFLRGGIEGWKAAGLPLVEKP